MDGSPVRLGKPADWAERYTECFGPASTYANIFVQTDESWAATHSEQEFLKDDVVKKIKHYCTPEDDDIVVLEITDDRIAGPRRKPFAIHIKVPDSESRRIWVTPSPYAHYVVLWVPLRRLMER